MWAADKFSEYINGIPVTFETDHKPLLQLLQTKPIDLLSLRIQRFRMRLMRYMYEIVYIPGKSLVLADTLSRSPLQSTSQEEEIVTEAEMYVNLITGCFLVKDYYLQKIVNEQNKDPIIQKLRVFCHNGWPSKGKMPHMMLPYYQHRNEI